MGEKQQLGSSSSLTSELFGSKDSYPSSSSGIFGSIFPPSSRMLGGESLRSELKGKTPSGTRDDMNDSGTQSRANKDMSAIYQDQKVQPCHLSSSIFYGGQDVYYHPQSAENAGLTSLNKKDGGEDDSGIASRGNWWQGKRKMDELADSLCLSNGERNRARRKQLSRFYWLYYIQNDRAIL